VAIGHPDECWLWQKCRYGKMGYGKWTICDHGGHRQIDAHRIAFELVNGPISSGIVIRHSCDNPPCCNPAHLLAGSHTDNILDMYRKGRDRGRGTRGENHGSAKLTEAKVRLIRQLYVRGTNQHNTGNSTALAKRFGIHPLSISAIVNRKSWTHVQ
jgi:hypothetical protein